MYLICIIFFIFRLQEGVTPGAEWSGLSTFSNRTAANSTTNVNVKASSTVSFHSVEAYFKNLDIFHPYSCWTSGGGPSWLVAGWSCVCGVLLGVGFSMGFCDFFVVGLPVSGYISSEVIPNTKVVFLAWSVSV